MELQSVVFVDGVRTPFARAGSLYSQTRADDLVVKVIRELLRRNPGLDPGRVDDVAIAAATQTGDQGMNIGRSAALLAGLPETVPGYSIDRWCAGAMTAVTTLATAIMAGFYDVAIAGGVEHMTRHPMGEGIDPNPRYLAEKLVDPDALLMGKTAEILHDRFPNLTKDRADAYAVASQEKTAKAYANGLLQPDLVPVAVRDSENGWGYVTQDEGPRPGTSMEGLAGLRTPFRAHGRVTAGNASALTDGATGAILASEPFAGVAGLSAKMRMVTFAFAGVSPEVMGIGPIPSAEKALSKVDMSIADMDIIEINEAFAIQVLAFLDHFGIEDDDPRVNPMGGAIAVGHPLAASGIRLMSNLARNFETNPDARYGMTTMCIGLGMGGTVIWERVESNAS